MRKAQLPLSALIGIVLFLIVLVPSVLWAKNLFRLSAQANNDFLELDKTIRSISESGLYSLESLPFRMDKKTALVFFASKADKVELRVRGSPIASVPGAAPYYEVIRPTECTNNCFCLCKELKETGKKNSYLCSQNICLPDYPAVSIVAQFCSIKLTLNCLDSTTGGSLLQRGALFTFEEQRARGLYVQKLEDTVVVCDELDQNGNCGLP